MRDSLLLWCDRIIRYGIYTLFFLVPLVFTNNTSELFELNKMWLTWEVTLFIAAAWFAKMIVQRRISLQRTPLDIPIALFFLSQVLSTIFSIDPHTSFWGYYSRFNGGLLSTITYIFLYYTIASNLKKEHILTILKVSLASGLIVILWGIPSHFGKDPTCLLFRGTFDVSCWTDAFKPTIRIFSTLGQPAWMAAYMNVLLPMAIAFSFLVFSLSKQNKHSELSLIEAVTSWKFLSFYFLSLGLYLGLIFAGTRAGIIAFFIASIVFWGVTWLKKYLTLRTWLTFALLFNGTFLALNFFFGTTFSQLDRFTLPVLLAEKQVTGEVHPTDPATPTVPNAQAPVFEGTNSGKIRSIVWRGAIEVGKAYPLFGSGVETFAFAYYRYRPAEHNMTSEWDYLYNKAHNEYLNYFATTGIVGLGTYLFFIGMFLYSIFRYLFLDKEHTRESILIVALSASFISILITNFFGFSVVIINMFLFLIPTFVFLLEPQTFLKKEFAYPRAQTSASDDPSVMQWTGITAISLVAFFFLIVLIRFWYADVAYALGSNLNRIQEYQQAYLKLGESVNLRPSEPVFADEFASNNAMIATLLLLQEGASNSAEMQQQSQLLSEQAIKTSNDIVAKYPKNITFWKSRVRLFYALAQADPRYLPFALDAVSHAHDLAPTDAKVSYNLGALYRESGNPEKSIAVLEETIRVKPDYRDAYYALAVAYNDVAIDTGGRVIRPDMREKAVAQLRFILQNISPNDKQAQELLSSWGISY
jgi:putative inorganic carbon (hco3(-)) transporter